MPSPAFGRGRLSMKYCLPWPNGFKTVRPKRPHQYYTYFLLDPQVTEVTTFYDFSHVFIMTEVIVNHSKNMTSVMANYDFSHLQGV